MQVEMINLIVFIKINYEDIFFADRLLFWNDDLGNILKKNLNLNTNKYFPPSF